MKLDFTDPTVTVSGGAYEAAVAVTTTIGGLVFVAGSELEQAHCAVGVERSSDLTVVIKEFDQGAVRRAPFPLMMTSLVQLLFNLLVVAMR